MSKKPAKPRTANHFIREWRLHRRMTQEKLGEEIDMTSGGLSQLENGVVNYTQPTLEAIAKALTCAPGTLLLVEPTVKSEDGIRQALLAYGVPAIQVDSALRAVKGFVEDSAAQSQSDHDRAQSAPASRRRVKAPS